MEEMEQNLSASLSPDSVSKPKTSKRKKDGIFYTPKYITKYIVENTVGTLCKEKKDELRISNLLIDDTYNKKDGKLNKKGEQLFNTLNSYKNWLLTLKILDPACGSGAFLNQTLDFLITEHKQADDIIAELTGETIRLFDTDKAILENNIFGVDINEESVEIAKLSLWLHTAQRGRPLSDLSDNIKCGNSLIDDPEVAGDKAFDWYKEFPQIFRTQQKKIAKKEIEEKPDYLNLIEKNAKLAQEKAEQSAKLSNEAIKYSKKVYEYTQKQKSLAEEAETLYGINKGGFDVVLENPPYVRIDTLSQKDKLFYVKNWVSAYKQYDLYILFYELGLKLLKMNGFLSFITPNKFYVADYGKKCRKYILENSSITDISDVSMMNIFHDASVYPTIITLKKQINIKNEIKIKAKLKDENELIQNKYEIIKQSDYLNADDNIINLNISNRQLISKVENQGQAIKDLFKITRGFRPPKEELLTKNKIDGAYPMLIGSALSKAYNIDWDGNFVIYKQKEIYEAKPVEFFLQPKILIRDISLKFNAYFDNKIFYALKQYTLSMVQMKLL